MDNVYKDAWEKWLFWPTRSSTYVFWWTSGYNKGKNKQVYEVQMDFKWRHAHRCDLSHVNRSQLVRTSSASVASLLDSALHEILVISYPIKGFDSGQ